MTAWGCPPDNVAPELVTINSVVLCTVSTDVAYARYHLAPMQITLVFWVPNLGRMRCFRASPISSGQLITISAAE